MEEIITKNICAKTAQMQNMVAKWLCRRCTAFSAVVLRLCCRCTGIKQGCEVVVPRLHRYKTWLRSGCAVVAQVQNRRGCGCATVAQVFFMPATGLCRFCARVRQYGSMIVRIPQLAGAGMKPALAITGKLRIGTAAIFCVYQ
jgi:hypothetical protein